MHANASILPQQHDLQTLSRPDFWQQHITQCRESGLSKMAYCQQFSLVYHQMVYWCTKADKQEALGGLNDSARSCWI